MYIDKEFYTAHINDRDKLVEMRRVLDKIEMVLNRHTVERTDFLDPYEIRLAKSILNRFSEIGYLVDGGFKDAERKVITIYPDYYQDEINTEIRALRANVGEDSVSHKDYLGAILSLGIDRSKLGDILIHEDFGYILVKEEISKFILYNLERIKNMKVKLENVPLSEITVPEAKYKEISRQIASPRLDSVISAGLNISRSKSA